MKQKQIKNGQAMVEYIVVFVALLLLVSVCACLVYAIRSQTARTTTLISSDYP